VSKSEKRIQFQEFGGHSKVTWLLHRHCALRHFAIPSLCLIARNVNRAHQDTAFPRPTLSRLSWPAGAQIE